MNIENFDPIKYSMDEIFERQKEIKFQYEPESQAIFEHFDIDTFEDQETFKKYCWRITEELTEALEDQQNRDHFKEELIDGFNFLIELCLLYGWNFDDVKSCDIVITTAPVREYILEVIYQLGITANCLKNRQWRQSQYLVDLYIFEQRFKYVWVNYMKLFARIGMDEEEVAILWSLKYQVNLFRLNSNY